jgi:hypothetical protein
LKQREYELTQSVGAAPKEGGNDGLQLDVVDLGSLGGNALGGNALGGNAFSETSSSVTSKPIVRSAKFPYNDITDQPPPKNVQWSTKLEDEPQLKSALRGANRKPTLSNGDSMMLKEFMESMTGYMETMRNDIDALKQGKESKSNDILSRMKKKVVHKEPVSIGDLEDISNNFTI